MSDEKEKKQESTEPILVKNRLFSISSGIAAIFLEKGIEKGLEIEIPSLKIKSRPKNGSTASTNDVTKSSE